MAREAALLGVNVYSFFAGQLGAADQSLANAGKLKILSTAKEITVLSFGKAAAASTRPARHNSETKQFVFRQICEFAASN